MFMNAQVRPLCPKNWQIQRLVVGLSQVLGSAGGIIQAIGAAFGGLSGAAVSALSEKHLAGRPAVWIFQSKSVVPAVCGAAVFLRLFRILVAARGAERSVDIGDSVSPALAMLATCTF
jgi:hypothetical protein